jgi:hypothetical protein
MLAITLSSAQPFNHQDDRLALAHVDPADRVQQPAFEDVMGEFRHHDDGYLMQIAKPRYTAPGYRSMQHLNITERCHITRLPVVDPLRTFANA